MAGASLFSRDLGDFVEQSDEDVADQLASEAFEALRPAGAMLLQTEPSPWFPDITANMQAISRQFWTEPVTPTVQVGDFWVPTTRRMLETLGFPVRFSQDRLSDDRPREAPWSFYSGIEGVSTIERGDEDALRASLHKPLSGFLRRRVAHLGRVATAGGTQDPTPSANHPSTAVPVRVFTNTPGLRVLCAPSYFFHRGRGSFGQSTPAQSHLQAGDYVFGADGPTLQETWDRKNILDVPYHTEHHLNF